MRPVLVAAMIAAMISTGCCTTGSCPFGWCSKKNCDSCADTGEIQNTTVAKQSVTRTTEAQAVQPVGHQTITPNSRSMPDPTIMPATNPRPRGAMPSGPSLNDSSDLVPPAPPIAKLSSSRSSLPTPTQIASRSVPAQSTQEDWHVADNEPSVQETANAKVQATSKSFSVSDRWNSKSAVPRTRSAPSTVGQAN